MKSENEPKKFNMVSFFAFMFTLAFTVLKLCNVIDWNWGLITLPLWGTFSLMILTAMIIAIVENNK